MWNYSKPSEAQGWVGSFGRSAKSSIGCPLERPQGGGLTKEKVSLTVSPPPSVGLPFDENFPAFWRKNHSTAKWRIFLPCSENLSTTLPNDENPRLEKNNIHPAKWRKKVFPKKPGLNPHGKHTWAAPYVSVDTPHTRAKSYHPPHQGKILQPPTPGPKHTGKVYWPTLKWKMEKSANFRDKTAKFS